MNGGGLSAGFLFGQNAHLSRPPGFEDHEISVIARFRACRGLVFTAAAAWPHGHDSIAARRARTRGHGQMCALRRQSAA